ncbi:MAG: helix-hairpin-helix domain-containing protein, partial [Patescibacteria group bacterium]
MINQEISEILISMAEILEFLGDPNDRFKIRALQNASLSIQEARESLEILAKEKRLREIPGIGEGIAKKIEEYIATGKVKEYEMLKHVAPKGFFEMMAIPFLGPKKIKVLYHELHIKGIEDLKKAIADGRVQDLKGFGEKSAQKILEGIEMKAQSKGRRLIGNVYITVQEIVENLKECKGVEKVIPAGSFRRCEETVGDIDILATGKSGAKITKYFETQPYVDKILASG